MTQTTILVPLDGSKIAEEGLVSACRLARETGATLWLMRAVSPNAPELGVPGIEQHAVQQATAYLHAVQENLRRQGFTAHSEVLPTYPVQAILFACEAHDIDLISICTHGLTGLHHALVGSVADAVIRRQPAPILITRAGHHPTESVLTPFRRLLVPLDGTTLAEVALAFLGKEHLGRNGEVILFRAVAPVQPPVMPMATGEVVSTILKQAEENTAQHRAEADSYLAATGNTYLRGSNWTPRSIVGYAGEEIPAMARTERADLIVMATHARHGFDKLVHGSVAGEVMRKAEVPILLVRNAEVGPAERPLSPTPIRAASAL